MLVSVVIPTYNRPVSLKRAINSVLSQTHKDIEIIVVDDNNPDTEARYETEQLMCGFSTIPCITYLKHERNKNGSAARNTGWRHARGEYITFLDDDDEIAPTKIQEQVSCLESLDNTWGACYTAYHTLMEDGTIQISTNSKSGDVYLQALMRTFYVGSGSNVLLRKKVVDEINGYDEDFKRNQDIEFMVRAFERYKVAYIPEPLLTIHWEVRDFNHTYEFVDGITKFYYSKMKDRIERLSHSDRHRVNAVIALERARIAFYYKEYKDIFKILKANNVTFLEICKYVSYLADRVVTKKSYGFYLE